MVLVKGCPQCGGVVEGYPASSLSCTRCNYRLTGQECRDLATRQPVLRRLALSRGSSAQS
jgi:hypothetical protein